MRCLVLERLKCLSIKYIKHALSVIILFIPGSFNEIRYDVIMFTIDCYAHIKRKSSVTAIVVLWKCFVNTGWE